MIGGRTLLQVLGLYAAGSWLVLQVVDVLTQNMELPDWVFPFALVLLLIGLPIILTTAVVQKRLGTSAAGPAMSGETPTAATANAVMAVSAPPEVRRLFTWRNALVGGGLAFLFLALVTGAFMYMRNSGVGPVGSLVAKGVLDERSPILLADIEGSDLELANAATEALRVDLSQSDIVRLVEPGTVVEGLARMERSSDSRLGEELARELAVREGIPAVVAGDLDAVGRGFSLAGRIVRPADGAVLASARAAAKDSTEVLEAIDQVSRQLREKVGESYGSLRSDEPLEKVTTSSLEALRKYSESMRLSREGGDEDASMALLVEAVALDSTFASAWRSLAIALGNRFQEPSRQLDALERAYRHRDRLTERERYFVEAAYHNRVTQNDEKAIEAYEAMLRLDPEDRAAINNIGVIHYWRGEHEKAVEYYRRAAAIDTTEALSAANVAVALGNTGDYEAADSAYHVLEDLPGHERFAWWMATFPSSYGEYDEAERRLAELVDSDQLGAADEDFALGALASIAAVEGRLNSASDWFARARDAARRVSPDHVLGRGLQQAIVQLQAVRDTAAAVATIDRTLNEVELRSLPVADWSAEWLATILAMTGQPDRAEALLDEASELLDPRLRPAFERNSRAARGEIALTRGDPERALEEFRQQSPDDCRPCAALGPARAFEAMGQADSAIVYYEEYIARPYHWRVFPDASFRADVLERLGVLYEEKDDLEQAAGWYAQLVELWEDADPELQPRVRAAQEKLEEIMRERG
jgi:tetratricopeptide (TPR) repeat protein